MNAALLKISLLAGFALSLPAALAQEDAREAEQQAELERQEIFRAGFQDIVTDLNNNSFERFARAIDRDDMLDRIFGLRPLKLMASLVGLAPRPPTHRRVYLRSRATARRTPRSASSQQTPS